MVFSYMLCFVFECFTLLSRKYSECLMEGFTPFIETFKVLKRSLKVIFVLFFFLTFGNPRDEGIDIVRE